MAQKSGHLTSLLIRSSTHYLPRGTGGSHEFVRHASSLVIKKGQHIIPKGTGGRSSVSGIVATVFGSTGFLGRYVVQQLAKMGSQVMVPFRASEDAPRHLKLMGDLGQVVPMKFNPRDEDTIKAAIAKSNVVINMIGRDYETRNFSFEDVHVDITEKLSRLSKEHGGVIRYINVSCLGASKSSPSKMLSTKALADEIALQNFPEATILKPGPIVGTEDRLLNRWAQLAKKMPYFPLIGGGAKKLQPVHVQDVAAAVISCVRDDGASMGKTYELGGPDVYTIRELVELVFDTIREHSHIVNVPVFVAKLLAFPREYLLTRVPFPIPSPNTFNWDELKAIEDDLIVSPDALTIGDLGVIPRKLKGIAIEHLHIYRTGGPSVGSTVGERISGAGF